MSLGDALFSSATGEWETPLALFNTLDDIFHFETDVCATYLNTKCHRFFNMMDDALTKEWRGVCWMNPPYGRGIGAWLKKAYESSLAGAVVVCLIPSRTDTAWWHDYVMKGEVVFIRGRLRFNNHHWNAPFPSALCVFK